MVTLARRTSPVLQRLTERNHSKVLMSLPWGRRSGPAGGVRATLCLRCYLDYTLLCPRVYSLGIRGILLRTGEVLVQY